MTLRPIHAGLGASLEDFMANPVQVVDQAGTRAVAIMSNDRVVFYVHPVDCSDLKNANISTGKVTSPDREASQSESKPYQDSFAS